MRSDAFVTHVHQNLSHLRLSSETKPNIAVKLPHLISTFATTNVNNDITIRELGECLRDDSLATTEGTRDCCCATLHATNHEMS